MVKYYIFIYWLFGGYRLKKRSVTKDDETSTANESAEPTTATGEYQRVVYRQGRILMTAW